MNRIHVVVFYAICVLQLLIPEFATGQNQVTTKSTIPPSLNFHPQRVDAFLVEDAKSTDSSLEDIFGYVKTIDNVTVPELLDELQKGELRSVVTSYPVTPPDSPGKPSLSGNVFTMPFAAAGACFAYNIPALLDVLVLSVDDLRHYIINASSSNALLNNATLILPLNSTMIPLIFAQLGISLDDIAKDARHIRWESAARMEGRKGDFTDEELVNTVRFLTLWGQEIAPVKCAAFLANHPVYNTPVPVSPFLRQNSRIDIDEEQWTNIAVVHDDGVPRATYPFLTITMVHISVDAYCNATDVIPFHYIMRMFTAERIEASLGKRGAAILARHQQLSHTADALTTVCDGKYEFYVANVCGSTTIKSESDYLSKAHFSRFSELPTENTGLIRHLAAGSAHGMDLMKANFSAFSYTEIVDEVSSNFHYWPFAAHGVSVIAHLPGAVDQQLTINKCAIPKIFFGDIKFWDDPAIKATNPFMQLPHREILVTVRSTGSGTNVVFLQGLKHITMSCDLPYKVPITHTFPRNVGGSPNMTTTSSTSDMSRHVRSTPFAIGFAFVPSSELVALGNHFMVVGLLNEHLGTVTQPQNFELNTAISKAVVHSNGFLELPELQRTDYPFIGITYIAIMEEYSVNCSNKKLALEFLKSVVDSATKDTLKLQDTSLVLVQPILGAKVQLNFSAMKCDSEYLFPMVSTPSTTANASLGGDDVDAVLSTGGIVGIILAVIVVSVIMIVTVVKMRYVLGSMKNTSMAPDDPQNVFILFFDIQNSMALWARMPGLMSTAFDVYVAVVRNAIKTHGAYEVKTIADHFMVACRTPECAVKMALQVQYDIHHYPWGELGDHIDYIYEQLEVEGINANGVTNLHSIEDFGANTGTNALFHGLRVRCGIANGHCTIIADNSGGIDYLGQTPNKASRIQQLAHGGQILCDRSVVSALSPTLLSELPVVVKSHGHIQLREINGRVPVEEIIMKAFRKRKFKGLCSDGFASASQSQSGQSASMNTIKTPRRALLAISPEGSQSTAIAGASSASANGRSMDNGKDCVDYLSIALSPLGENERAKVVKLLGKAWHVDFENVKRRAKIRQYNQRDAPPGLGQTPSSLDASGVGDDRPSEDEPSTPSQAPLDTTTLYLAELSKLITQVVASKPASNSTMLSVDNGLLGNKRAVKTLLPGCPPIPTTSTTATGANVMTAFNDRNSSISVSSNNSNPFMISNSSGVTPSQPPTDFEGLMLPKEEEFQSNDSRSVEMQRVSSKLPAASPQQKQLSAAAPINTNGSPKKMEEDQEQLFSPTPE